MWSLVSRLSFHLSRHYGGKKRFRNVSSYCLLFPGQGSQFVGMAEKLITGSSVTYPGVEKLFTVAHRVLGRDLKSLFLCGPQSLLDETIHCQPAVVVASLAAMESLKQTHPQILLYCKAAAGFSVGEITALIVSGSINLEQGLFLVKARALAMQQACLETPSSMLTVIGLTQDTLKEIITYTGTSNSSSSLATIANYIFSKGFVVSGNTGRINLIGEEAKKMGAIVKDVKVSGAFHSKLMTSAVVKIKDALKEVDVLEPMFPVYSNVTGLPYGSADEIRTGLALQVTNPVLWDSTIHNMMYTYCKESRDNEMKFMGIGPGNQLKGMLKRIDKAAYRNCVMATV